MVQTVEQLSKRIHPVFICLIILLLLWMLFFWRFLTTNPVDQLRFDTGDFTLHYYAFASYHVEQIQAGNLIPLWNPYNYAGDPFLGNVQWATIYPMRYVMAFFAGADGLSIEEYQLEMALHYLFASMMMLLFLKQLTKRWEAALFGSLLYAYGGYLAGYPMLQPSVLEAVVWTPLLMLGVHLSVNRSRWQLRGIVLGSFAIALSFLAGHPQTTMQMIYFAGAYLLYFTWEQKISVAGLLWRGILLVGLGTSLAMIQLLAGVEFSSLSARVQQLFYDAKASGFSPQEFFQVFYPFIISGWSPLYIGVVGFLMAIASLFSFRRAYLFWLLTIFATIFLSMGGKNIVYDFFYLVIPAFNTFRTQERVISLAVFALVVLASYRLDLMLTNEAEHLGRQRIIILVHLIVTGLIAAVMSLAAPYLESETFFYPLRGEISPITLSLEVFSLVAMISLLFAAWFYWQNLYKGQRWLLAIPLIALVVVDLFTFNTRYTPNFVPNQAEYITQPPLWIEYLQQDVSQIQWRVDGSVSIQGHGTFWRIPDMYGTGPFELASTEAIQHIGVDKRWELFSVRYASQPDGATPPDYLNATPVLEGINYSGAHYTLYELPNPRPMAHLVYEYRFPEDSNLQGEALEKAILQIVNGAINLRETAVTAHPLAFDLSGIRPEGAEVTHFQMLRAEYIEITATTPESALLTVSIPNFPGWQATVNGEPVEIVEVYGGLIGIPLHAGESQQLVLEMRSQTYFYGAIVSGLSLILALGLLLGSFRASREETR